jgi:hypothetical protein
MNMGKMTKMAVAAMLLATIVASSASAEMIQIQLGGVGLSYDGSTIVDTGSADPDPLTNATFLADELWLGADITGVTLDLNIPGVSNIPVDGGQVSSAINGSLDLDLGGGEFLNLTLDSVTVNYIKVISTVQFVFAGASSTIDDQNLPYDLSLVDPVSVSFSTQIKEIADDGTYVTSFTSAGTGEIQGVPEPATLGILAFGGIMTLWRKRRNIA